MRTKTKKVLEHLAHQGALTTNLKPKRHAITLPTVLQAGEEEPRILEVLPGLIALDKAGLVNLNRDLWNYPELQNAIKNLHTKKLGLAFQGTPIEDIRKQYKILRKIYERKKKKEKSQNLNIRISQLELDKLQALARQQKVSVSHFLRSLIHEASLRKTYTPINT